MLQPLSSISRSPSPSRAAKEQGESKQIPHKWKEGQGEETNGKLHISIMIKARPGLMIHVKYANLRNTVVYLLGSLETDQIPSVVAVVMAASFSEYRCS
jgi:hypothetical protein